MYRELCKTRRKSSESIFDEEYHKKKKKISFIKSGKNWKWAKTLRISEFVGL
jgi:hypothetical protein